MHFQPSFPRVAAGMPWRALAREESVVDSSPLLDAFTVFSQEVRASVSPTLALGRWRQPTEPTCWWDPFGCTGFFANQVEAVAAALKQRATEGIAKRADGSRPHPTGYIETLAASVSVPPGCLFVGHTNTDLDSVGGAVGAAELYDGRACIAQPPQELNGEIMYAISYARTGEKPDWAARDIEAWRAAVCADGLGARELQPFGTAARGSLAPFNDVFVGTRPRAKVCMVDHSAPAQMVPELRQALIDEGDTDCLAGVIDHHALDQGCYTKGPLFMDVRPWGSMSTIVAHSFIRSAKPFPCCVFYLSIYLSIYQSIS